MSKSNLVTIGVVIAIVLFLISKLFWIALGVGAVWVCWKLFLASDTYKKYS